MDLNLTAILKSQTFRCIQARESGSIWREYGYTQVFSSGTLGLVSISILLDRDLKQNLHVKLPNKSVQN